MADTFRALMVEFENAALRAKLAAAREERITESKVIQEIVELLETIKALERKRLGTSSSSEDKVTGPSS